MNADSHCSYIAELINFIIDKSGENQRVSVSTLMNEFEKKHGSFNESRELVENRISQAVKSLLKRCPGMMRRTIWMTGYNTKTGKFEDSSSTRAPGEGTSGSQEIASRPGQAPPTQAESKLEAINTPNPVKSQQNGSCSNGVGPSTSAAVPAVPQFSGAPKFGLRLPRRPVEENTDARTTAGSSETVVAEHQRFPAARKGTPDVMISPIRKNRTAPAPSSMSSPSPTHNRQNGNSLNRGLPDVSAVSQSSGSWEIRSGLPVEAVSTAKKSAGSSAPASRTEQQFPATVNGSPPVTTFLNPTGRNETAPGAAEPAVNKKRGLNLEASSPQTEKKIRAWRPSGYQLSPAVGTPNLAGRNRTLPVRSQPNGCPQNGGGASGISSKSSEPTTSSSSHASTSKSNGVNEAPRSVEPVVYNFGNYQQQWDGKEKQKPPVSLQKTMKSSPILSNDESRDVSEASPLTIDSEHQNGGGASGTSSKSSETTTSSSSHASTSKSNGVNEARRSGKPLVYNFGNYQPQFDNTEINPEPEPEQDLPRLSPSQNDNIETNSADSSDSPMNQADDARGSEAQTIPSSSRKRQNEDTSPPFVVPKLPIKVPNPLKRPAEEESGDRNSSLSSRGAGKRKVIKPREFTPYEDRKGKYETGERSMEGMLDKLREPSVPISRGSSPDSQAPVVPVSGLPTAKRGRGRPPGRKNQRQVLRIIRIAESFFIIFRPPTAPIPPAPQEEQREPSVDSTQPSSSVTPATAVDVIAVTDLAVGKVRSKSSKIAPAPPVEVEDQKNEDPSPTLAVLKLREPSTSTSYVLSPDSQFPVGPATPMCPAPQEEPREPSEDICMPYSRTVTLATADNLFPHNRTMYEDLSRVVVAATDRALGKTPADKRRGRQPKIAQVDVSPRNPVLADDPLNRPSTSTAESIVSHQGANPILLNEESGPSPLLIDSDDIAPTLNTGHSSNPEPAPEPELPRMPPSQNDNNSAGSSDSPDEQEQPAGDEQGSETQSIREPSSPPTFAVPTLSPNRSNPLKLPAEEDSKDTNSPKLTEPSASTSHGLEPVHGPPTRKSPASSEDISMPLCSSVAPATARNRALEKARAAKVAKKVGKIGDKSGGRKPKVNPAPPVEAAQGNSTLVEDPLNRPSTSTAESIVSHQGAKKPSPILEESRPSPLLIDSDDIAPALNPAHSSNPEPVLEPELPRTSSPSVETSPAGSSGSIPEQEESADNVTGSEAQTIPSSSRKRQNADSLPAFVVPKLPIKVPNPLKRPAEDSSRKLKNEDPSPTLAVPKLPKLSTSTSHGLSPDSQLPVGPAASLSPAPQEGPRERTSAPKDVSEDLVTFLRRMTQIVIQPIAVEVLAGLYWVQTPNVEVEGIQRELVFDFKKLYLCLNFSIEKILNSMFNLDIDASTKALILYMTQAPVPKRLFAQICKEEAITLQFDHERKIFQCQTKSIALTRNVNVELEEWDPTEMEEMMTFMLTEAQANGQLTLNDICKMYQQSVMNERKKRAAEDVRIK
ncbi:hypothetical protein CRE_13202 [Caenorhabditis remanei]|uniref:SPK domain-containing protein n=1 Tax=Caenorhabditis remanei TaxID=31234 RepID=E3NS80_CAERE|nr:hypothetical protein CRE_13202 [Caenorhabditis remanei]